MPAPGRPPLALVAPAAPTLLEHCNAYASHANGIDYEAPGTGA